MTYRTKTYIAGDWTGDKDLIDKIYEWNKSNYWNLSFTDAHELTQARDDSLPCTVKKSLSERLNASKTFVLIVGADTRKLTKGSCKYCDSYYNMRCYRGYSVDFRSYINYECDKARKDDLKIVVIYNYASIDREKCPEAVRYEGKHIPAYYYKDGKRHWNYSDIKDAIMN